MVSLKLLKYLCPEYAVYHVRSVNLIWQLESATAQPHVEAVISQSLTNKYAPYEAFGTLWRLTGGIRMFRCLNGYLRCSLPDDNVLPGFKLKVPMMIMLDTLKSEDVNIRRIGETWMRCSLKSYLRSVLVPGVCTVLILVQHS
jgi:hypothetical protein